MPFYRDHVYPHLVSALGDPKPIREIRQRIVPLAEGEVLEIGVGPGVNFVHYNAVKIAKVYALEPNPGMIRLAERQRSHTRLDIQFVDLQGERIPLEDGAIDTVVSTFTLCTIPGVIEAIRGIRRVLKPTGRLVFLEHGLSPDPKVQRWQRLCEPISRKVFEGCHLTRDIPSLLAQGGFQIEQMEVKYIAEFPRAWTHCWWGTAIPKSQQARTDSQQPMPYGAQQTSAELKESHKRRSNESVTSGLVLEIALPGRAPPLEQLDDPHITAVQPDPSIPLLPGIRQCNPRPRFGDCALP